jgi:hypothetical protein
MGERTRVQAGKPAAGHPHGIDEDEATDAGGILGGAEHRDAAAPRVAEDVPRLVDGAAEERGEGGAEGGEVAAVVLDAGGAGTGGRRARTASALVVEDELPPGGERRECRPEHPVVEQKAAVHAAERRRAGHRRRGPDGEVEPADPDRVPREVRRPPLGGAEGEIALAGGGRHALCSPRVCDRATAELPWEPRRARATGYAPRASHGRTTSARRPEASSPANSSPRRALASTTARQRRRRAASSSA